jgi:hypothetical protein
MTRIGSQPTELGTLLQNAPAISVRTPAPLACAPHGEFPEQAVGAASSLDVYAQDFVVMRHARLHASAQSLTEERASTPKHAVTSVRVLTEEAAEDIARQQGLARIELILPKATDAQLVTLAPFIKQTQSCTLLLDCTAVTIAGLNRLKRELAGMEGALSVHFTNPDALPDASLKRFADALGLVFLRQGDSAWMGPREGH